MDAPAIDSHEQNVWRFECQTYFSISASSRHGRNHERVSKVAPSLGKTASFGFCLWGRMDSNALTASAFRCTVRADPFLVFVRSIVRRSRLTCPHVSEYCSESRIPVFTDTTNSAR